LKRIVAFGAPFGAILENELNQLEEMLLNHKNVLLYTFLKEGFSKTSYAKEQCLRTCRNEQEM